MKTLNTAYANALNKTIEGIRLISLVILFTCFSVQLFSQKYQLYGGIGFNYSLPLQINNLNHQDRGLDLSLIGYGFKNEQVNLDLSFRYNFIKVENFPVIEPQIKGYLNSSLVIGLNYDLRSSFSSPKMNPFLGIGVGINRVRPRYVFQDLNLWLKTASTTPPDAYEFSKSFNLVIRPAVGLWILNSMRIKFEYSFGSKTPLIGINPPVKQGNLHFFNLSLFYCFGER